MRKNLLNFLALILFYLHLGLASDIKPVEDEAFWKNIGITHLKQILKETEDEGFDLNKINAKNIIFFLGDGMGMTTITAGRIYKGQLKNEMGENSSLVFDKFPHIGLAKTYNVDKQVPDSASTATALFSGIKTNYGYVGVDSTSSPVDSTKGQLTSMMEWAQATGKYTGIVTNTRITHATPASAYAKIYDRDWECDWQVPIESRKAYKDIGRQLVENSPGNKFNVIFGGGLEPMGFPNELEQNPLHFYGSEEKVCRRNDTLNLVQNWLSLKPTDTKKIRKFVQSRNQLLSLNTKNVSNVLGLFRNNHLNYALVKQPDEPSLSEMVQQAIKLLSELSLSNGNKGYVLMVEGGRIDHGNHYNYARATLQEVVELDAAINIANNMTNQKESLIIVTSDHSHALTFSGYPDRGNDILGTSIKDSKYPYETLSYANGPGFNYHRYGLNTTYETIIPYAKRYNTWIPKELLTKEQRASPTYMHLASLPLEDETHGGEDVPVYAKGPGSVLVRGVFEQNYIGWLISYVGCIGPAKSLNPNCLISDNHRHLTNGSAVYVNKFNIMIMFLSFFLILNTL